MAKFGTRKFLVFGMVVALAMPSSAAWRNGHPAKLILTQGFAFANGGNIFVTDKTTYGSEMLIVPDRDNNRVVVYKTAPTANDAAFDFAIFGADAAPPNGMDDPMDACIGPAGQLLVVDRGKCRVLIWNTFPTAGNVKADIVLGQAGFTDADISSNRGDNTLRNFNTMANPEAVAVFGNKLFVVDQQNNRVLIWNTFPTVSGQPADIVIGQLSATVSVNDKCDEFHMSSPRGIAISPDGKLLVGNQDQNRVMIWNSIPTATGQKADLVIGQPNLFTKDFGTSATSLYQPIGISIGRDGKVAVADKINGRVLIWNSVPTENGKAADLVIGQRDMNSSANVAGSITFENEDIRAIGGSALGVDWTADGRLWTTGATTSVRHFDPEFAPVVPDYAPPEISPRVTSVASGAVLTLTVANGKAPFTFAQVPTGQPNDYYGNNPCATTFDAATGTITAAVYNKHQSDNMTPQLFTVKDAKGNVDTAVITVFPKVEMQPVSGTVFSGNAQYLNAYGGTNAYGDPWTFEFVQNSSGGTIAPSPYGAQQVYTPGPNGGTDIIVAKDKDGHEARATYEVAKALTINEANGAPTFTGNIDLTVGQTFTFTASGGSGSGYRYGNYNAYYIYSGNAYGNGTITPEGVYTAKRAGQDQVYVNDSAYNAYTITVTIR
jgi:WD40 repeat protein